MHINPNESTLFWATSDPGASDDNALPSSAQFPDLDIDHDGVEPRGSPLRSDDYYRKFVSATIDKCASALSLIQSLGDARIRFDLRRVPASACPLQHVAKLTPPRATILYYARSNDVPVLVGGLPIVVLEDADLLS